MKTLLTLIRLEISQSFRNFTELKLREISFAHNVVNSDVVGASPVGAAPTTSSFST